MSVIIRETFIGLHSSNVLQRLSDEFKERYKGYKISLASIATLLPKLPALGKVMQVEEGKEASEVSEEEVAPLLEKSMKSADAALKRKEKARKKKAMEAFGSEFDEDEYHREGMGEEGMGEEGEGEGEGEGEEGEFGEFEGEEPVRKERRGRKSAPLESKFVEMTELLPIVPKKGVFDVDRVKNSLYFFS